MRGLPGFARALDQVERGEPVVVERRGRRFRIVAEPATAPRKRPPAPFFEPDAKLLDEGWTWTWRGQGESMRLRAGTRRR